MDLVLNFVAQQYQFPLISLKALGRRSEADKARFLNIAEGSLEECRYYLILAHDLNYLDKAFLWKQTEEIGKLLNAYRRAILTPNF